MDIYYLLLFVIIIFLILNFNCKETFNVGGQLSDCESYIINANEKCSGVLEEDTIIPQDCCEAITPNNNCNWIDIDNKDFYTQQLHYILQDKYDICLQQETQLEQTDKNCNKNTIIKFINDIHDGAGIDCVIDDSGTITKCGPTCKNIFTEFYKNCQTQIKKSEFYDDFSKVSDVCSPT